MKEAADDLAAIGAVVKSRFDAQKRVLSFGEYLALFRAHPTRHGRDAARYLRDCFDHFGTTEVMRAGVKTRRFRLFDLPFDAARSSAASAEEAEREGRRRHDHLIGHEEIQEAFYRVLRNFAREGRVNRLVMLHGPNGSAKSTFVNCLMKGLEHYSEHDEGAQYVFSWIFPRGRDGRTVGFGSADDSLPAGESYALLPDARIDLRLASEVRENPLLLLPLAERRQLVRAAWDAVESDEPPPALILDGQLGAKNKMIFEALLTAYRGDLAKVLMHVRVERFYISQRYRQGAVTIGPQLAVDAQERQITVDRSLSALPASLSSLVLYETHGELVEATGGVLEFSDLLKRPLDHWRYLLLAVEEGEIALSTTVLPLNTVFVATSNDVHLKAFKEHHEYRSFRGRLSLVRVPYLLDYRQEQRIYDSQIVPQAKVHVAPHATYVAALWAVLTRLRRPQVDGLEVEKVGPLAATLSPIEKAELYADSRVPSRFSNDETQLLRAHVLDVRAEHDHSPVYEGSTGASPREVRSVLLDAAQDPGYRCLSPLAVLARIRELCEGDDYDFLREAPEGGYQDPRAFVEVVRERWLDRVDDEFRRSTGLVEETQYLDLFDRYVTHVSYWVKQERVFNPMTGQYEEADVELMKTVETMLGARDGESFRRNLISQVAGHAIDHPGEKPRYPQVFPRYIEQMREATYGGRRKQLAEIARDALVLLQSGEDQGAAQHLKAERVAKARRTVASLKADFGYQDTSVVDALGEVLARRYAE